MLLIFFTGCKDGFQNVLPKGDKTDISIIGDRTDVLKQVPSNDVQPIYNIYNIDDDNNLYNGYRLRFRDVADISQTDVQSLSVGAVSPLLSNNNERVAELKSFKDKVKEVFENAKKNYQQTENRSFVFSTVVTEANFLSHSDAQNKYLIIFSNMLDHTDDYLDIYNPVMRDLIVRHPEQVMQSLESKMKIESLKGVKVIVVYQAQDHDISEERLFLISKNFYEALLRRHGADVVTVSSLNLIAAN